MGEWAGLFVRKAERALFFNDEKQNRLLQLVHLDDSTTMSVFDGTLATSRLTIGIDGQGEAVRYVTDKSGDRVLWDHD